jgi:hypothetical protein
MKKAGAPELIGSEREFPGLQPLLTVMVMANTDDDESLRLLFGSPLRVNGLLLETRCDVRPVDLGGAAGSTRSPSFTRRPSQKISCVECDEVDIQKVRVANRLLYVIYIYPLEDVISKIHSIQTFCSTPRNP